MKCSYCSQHNTPMQYNKIPMQPNLINLTQIRPNPTLTLSSPTQPNQTEPNLTLLNITHTYPALPISPKYDLTQS